MLPCYALIATGWFTVNVQRRTRIGAAILDVNMAGGGSGVHVLERLRTQSECAQIPEIVLTGGLLTEDE